MAGTFFWLLFRSIRHRDSIPILLQVILVAGLIGVSAVTINIEREFIAYPVAFAGGLLLGIGAYTARKHARSRLVDTTAIFLAASLSPLSLNIDWFDARGVITAGTLLCVGFLLPPGRPAADTKAAKLAAVVLAGGGVVLLWMLYGLLFGPDEALALATR